MIGSNFGLNALENIVATLSLERGKRMEATTSHAMAVNNGKSPVKHYECHSWSSVGALLRGRRPVSCQTYKARNS